MRIVFMGTPQAAVPSLERLVTDGHEMAAVYTQPDRPSGRGNKVSFTPVKEFTLQKNLPILQPVKIKTGEVLADFESHNADVAVVVAYGRILPEKFLTAFPKGAINVHFSLLPKYRGAAPVNWAIVNGETETGVTTMQMDAGLDTGAILLQRKTKIGSEENSIDLMTRLSHIGADLLSETLAGYNELVPKTQDDTKATLAPIMKKEDGLIDWSMTAEEISNRVRGFQPFPTSYFFYQSKKITLWKVAAFERAERPASNGEVLKASGEIIAVGCGNGTILQIEEMQAEGKRRMSVRDFLNGNNMREGDTLI